MPAGGREWKTRKAKIDPKLTAWGWKVVPYSESKLLSAYTHHAVEEYPTSNGPADYALIVNGRILGIIEAKKPEAGSQEVLRQAERYARVLPPGGFDFDGFRAPFLYSTNGEKIRFRNVQERRALSRNLAAFHTPAALEELLERDTQAAGNVLLNLPNDHPKLRSYQIQANAATEQAIREHKRKMLLAMATGSGKTFTTVNQAYRLVKSGVARRILFLVDRRSLAAQAAQAFDAFEYAPGKKFGQQYEVYSQRMQAGDLEEGETFNPKLIPNEYLENPQAKHCFVYVCTIQRMSINLFGRAAMFSPGEDTVDEDAAELKIPIHAFDCIVADECHRGYTTAEEATWRDTLEHFDAIKIGLTATPAAHTKAYFREVVFRYTYEQAVLDGHLVDYQPVKIDSKVRIQGVFLNEGERVAVVDPESGAERLDEVEDERTFDATEVEQSITAPNSNRKILEEIRKYAQEHEALFERFPKTLIFAVHDKPNISHADQLTALAREVFGRGEDFVQKITGRADRPLKKIREFRNRPEPGIVVTVDMLSTGVDIPDLEFIVFLRPVKSRILFTQMIGRGTRKGFRFPNKPYFTVFDCFNGTLLEYFRNATDIPYEPPEKQARSIREIIQDIWDNRDRDYNAKALAKRLQRIDKAMSGRAREMFAAYIPDGDLAGFAADLPRGIRHDFTATMKLLRDPNFLNLLENYERAPKTFIRADGVEDEVTSERLIRDGLGNTYKPEDYLDAFERFVRENPSRIEAIRILLDRPKDWSTQALKELREKLAGTKERFTPENLQKAHEMAYHKALVDIISMVKHAARKEEPLFTAAERVNKAIEKVAASLKPTPEQAQWLERIRAHLVESLSIDPQDFDLIPVFEDFGGLGKANKVFGGKLKDLLKKINSEIAA